MSPLAFFLVLLNWVFSLFVNQNLPPLPFLLLYHKRYSIDIIYLCLCCFVSFSANAHVCFWVLLYLF
uniref:Uncharacterized protein n=1 Tax=Rhizophora mucronata TaxID=61149 RepID=A0A2P2K6I0_RHIMU